MTHPPMSLQDHHAYLVEHPWAESKEALETYIEKTYNISLQGNPDVWSHYHQTLSVDHARELQAHASRKTTANWQVFMIGTERITAEAQNALLKLFEEPAPRTVFFLVVRDRALLLLTLQSRLSALELNHQTRTTSEDAQTFFVAPSSKRLEHVVSLIETKDLAEAHTFLDALETYISKKDSALRIQALPHIINTRKHLGLTGASWKLLFEQLALVLPQI